MTGSIHLSSGATIALSGIYVKATGYLNVTGDGFTLEGFIVNGELTGTYTAPGGYGSNVAASTSTSGNPVKVYCGVYNELTPTTKSGTFNMILDTPSITIVTSDGNTFYGSLSDSSVTIYFSGTSGPILATGTLNATHAQGTYDVLGEVPKHGTWSADICE